MPWRKSAPELVERFDDALPKARHIERRKMFGYPCAFAAGNMFAGLHEQKLFLRLPEAKRDKILALQGATRFEPMSGRVMREYVVVPPRMLSDRTTLRRWLRESLRYAESLPVKIKPARHK